MSLSKPVVFLGLGSLHLAQGEHKRSSSLLLDQRANASRRGNAGSSFDKNIETPPSTPKNLPRKMRSFLEVSAPQITLLGVGDGPPIYTTEADEPKNDAYSWALRNGYRIMHGAKVITDVNEIPDPNDDTHELQVVKIDFRAEIEQVEKVSYGGHYFF